MVTLGFLATLRFMRELKPVADAKRCGNCVFLTIDEKNPEKDRCGRFGKDHHLWIELALPGDWQPQQLHPDCYPDKSSSDKKSA